MTILSHNNQGDKLVSPGTNQMFLGFKSQYRNYPEIDCKWSPQTIVCWWQICMEVDKIIQYLTVARKLGICISYSPKYDAHDLSTSRRSLNIYQSYAVTAIFYTPFAHYLSAYVSFSFYLHRSVWSHHTTCSHWISLNCVTYILVIFKKITICKLDFFHVTSGKITVHI